LWTEIHVIFFYLLYFTPKYCGRNKINNYYRRLTFQSFTGKANKECLSRSVANYRYLFSGETSPLCSINNRIYIIVQSNTNVYSVITIKGKGKAIPLQAWRDPEVSRRLRLPELKTMGT